MERINLSRLTPTAFLEKARKNKCYTVEQVIVSEIWEYFGRRLPFARLMKLCKTHGKDKLYRIFREVAQSKAENPLGLFIFKTKK